MKIQLWSVGKDHEPYVRMGIEDFTRRVGRYYPVEWRIIPVPKNSRALPPSELKKKEAGVLLEYLSKEDWLVALDERGRSLSSEGLAQLVQKKANDATKNLIFLIGGVYGLDETILRKAGNRWSLSELTFPHQLVRLLLSEQLYRACTILRNEKYHHQ